MKTEDITDQRIFEAIRQRRAEYEAEGEGWRLCVSRWDIQAKMPEFPKKLVDAKLYLMIRKKRLNGCGSNHNCRGDFHFIGED